jgi:solute carrier family 25 (mitochondrial carnitine/acylcarnitine transporter), member 20/29
MSPVELIKVSLQCYSWTDRNSATTSTTPTAPNKAMYNWHPQLAVTRGLAATLLRDGIPHGVWFVAYDVCKTTLCQHSEVMIHNDHAVLAPTVVPVSVSLVSGAVAATVAWLVGYPADVIKTRIQAQASFASSAPSSSSSLGIVSMARLLIAEAQGNVLAGLYRGLGLKLVRAIPSSMIGFTVYEHVKDWCP